MANIEQETTEIDELLVIDNPIINTLIQAKFGIAQQYKIRFDLDIQSTLISLNIKPFDLVKITGNLIDNAIDVVKNLDQKNRKVKLTIKKQNNTYIIGVFNPRPTIPSKKPDKTFESSFNAIIDSELYNRRLVAVKNMVYKYKGIVSVNSFETKRLKLPLSCL